MSSVSLLANACNVLKEAADRGDEDRPDIGESLELLFGECSLANPEAQIEAARHDVFDSIRRLLPEETGMRDHLWMVASRVLMANNISWSHLNEHLQAFFDLAKRHFEEADSEDEEGRGAIVMFLETVASFSASSPHFFRLFSENAEMATESVWLCGGSLLFFLGRAARLQRDGQLRQAVMQLMHSFSMKELMYMLQNADESKKGEWEVALLELYGAEPGNPDVQALVSAGVLEGQIKDVCRCALGEKRSDKRSHVYSHDYLDVLVNISSVPEIAERMIAAGYLEVCSKTLEIEQVDEGKKESVLVGQGACLETLSHMASFAHLRDTVSKALTAKPGGLAATKERFEKLRGSKDPRIRAGAQRLLFELKWLSEEATPEEVLARGPEAEAAYHKALSLGKAHFKSMKLVLLGEDRSGKSSVLASVTGAGWDDQMQSTHGVSASRFKLGRKGWKEQPGGLTASEVAANTTAVLLRETSENEAGGDGAAATGGSPTAREKKTGVSDGQPASGGQPAAGGKSPGGVTSKRSGENRERKTSLMDTFEASALPLDAIALALQGDPEEVRVLVKDTAGQPRYYGMLAGALSKISMPIIVFSLPRWGRYVLEDPAFAECSLHMGLNMSRARGDQDEESTLGEEERLFRYWLSMVKTRTDEGSMGIIVGTHFDEVHKLLKKEADVQSFLARMAEKIKSFLKPLGLQNVFFPCQERSLCFFPVDNSRALRRHGVDELQQAIREMVKDSQTSGPHREPRPLLYVKLLDMLRADGQPPYLRVRQVAQLAAHFNLEASEPEVREGLAFLHELGEVQFFADAAGLASEGVFTDPDLLALAQANILDCPRVLAKMTEQADLLHESAILSRELLPEIWKNLLKLEAPKAQPRSKHEPTDFKEVLLDFLRADCFLLPLKGGQFMVPSLLRRWTPQLEDAPEDIGELVEEVPLEDAVAMDLGGLSVPDLFPQILAKLMGREEMEALQDNWDSAFLYRNALQIDLPACTLIALECPVEKPERVVLRIRDFEETEWFESPAKCLLTLVEILHEAAAAVAKSFAQHVVIGPMLQANGVHVVPLQELLEKTKTQRKGGKLPTKLPVKCRTWQRPLQLSSLPKWAQQLMEESSAPPTAAQQPPTPSSSLPLSSAGALSRPKTETGPTEMNSVTVAQLKTLAEEVRLRGEADSVNMYRVNDILVKPACCTHKKPYARILNAEGLSVECFVTHAWKEELQKFVRSIELCFAHAPEKPSLWICIFAIIQSENPLDLSEQLGNDPAHAPFTEALKRANRYLVVRNDAVDVFARIWCCWELYCAAQGGFLQSDKYIVTGPSRFPNPENWDIGKADASNLEDKRLIMLAVASNQEIYHTIIEKAVLIRNHHVPEEDQEKCGNPARWMARSLGGASHATAAILPPTLTRHASA